jgi:hypothetical protein
MPESSGVRYARPLGRLRTLRLAKLAYKCLRQINPNLEVRIRGRVDF